MDHIYGILLNDQSAEQLGLCLQNLCTAAHHRSLRWPCVFHSNRLPLQRKAIFRSSDPGSLDAYSGRRRSSIS